MFRGYWFFAIAIGLSIAASGQAQEQIDRSQQNTQAEQGATDEEPFSVPVRIIEDEAQAEARERREAESAQREKEDLVAQQGMNAATQAMNEATQSMKKAAWWSLVAVGTGLLIWTLLVSRQANAAARDAVEVTREIGNRQTRAYCGVENISAIPVKDPDFKDGRPLYAEVIIKNFGQTPAHECSGRAVLVTYAQTKGVLRQIKKPPIKSRATLNPGAPFSFTIPLAIPNEAAPPDERIVVIRYWRYADCFGERRASHFRYYLDADAHTFIPAKKGNYST